jgi:uncharacterized lipoprotein YajG
VSIFELEKKSIAALLLALMALMALVMLSACSSTEETRIPSNPCGCPQGDVDCHETCVREVIP